jgi:hypothetical protein
MDIVTEGAEEVCCDGDDDLLEATASLQSEEPGSEVAVLHGNRRPGALGKLGPQSVIPLADAGASPLIHLHASAKPASV